MSTINDVAKRAGVAISTVSNMINGTKYVSPETTARIIAAIDELGYEADPIARNMKSARSNMIGVIITNFSRVFFGRLLRECRGPHEILTPLFRRSDGRELTSPAH